MVTNINFDLLEQKIISIIVFILLYNFIYEFHNIFVTGLFAIGDHFNCTILLSSFENE